MWRIIYCESKYEPFAKNPRSEAIGPAQLLPGAHNGLEIFRSFGYNNPNDPEQVIEFINDVMNGRGGVTLRSQWSLSMNGCPGSP